MTNVSRYSAVLICGLSSICGVVGPARAALLDYATLNAWQEAVPTFTLENFEGLPKNWTPYPDGQNGLTLTGDLVKGDGNGSGDTNPSSNVVQPTDNNGPPIVVSFANPVAALAFDYANQRAVASPDGNLAFTIRIFGTTAATTQTYNLTVPKWNGGDLDHFYGVTASDGLITGFSLQSGTGFPREYLALLDNIRFAEPADDPDPVTLPGLAFLIPALAYSLRRS